VLVVHAGNRIDGPDRARARFPSDREQAVADRLGELLDVLAPEGVITSAAAGADLLIVEAAEKRQIPVHLVLPFPRARFCAVSVRDQGPRWVSAFEHAVERADRASSLVELDLEPDVDGLLAGNQALLDRASALARTGLLVVAVRRAGDAGLFVIEIDPATGR
jgi:hypothetical protein